SIVFEGPVVPNGSDAVEVGEPPREPERRCDVPTREDGMSGPRFGVARFDGSRRHVYSVAQHLVRAGNRVPVGGVGRVTGAHAGMVPSLRILVSKRFVVRY